MNILKKLIAIDLDGTTLNAQSIITPKTINVLKRATAAGHFVTIATGRPYRMSEHFYHELNLTTPMVNFNGALVHLPGKHWAGEMESHIKRDIVFEILEQKKKLNLDFVAVENRDSFYIDSLNFFDAKFFASKATNNNLLTSTNLVNDPNSILIRTQSGTAAAISASLMKQFGNDVDVRTWGGPQPILEIVAKGIQKATGVAHIADYLQVNQKDVMAFGDEHNDVEMLEYAGLGVAMKNGSTEAKAVANDQTDLTNDEDGLADYLEKHLAL